MPATPSRYYVKEHSGFLHPRAGRSGHKVVWSSLASIEQTNPGAMKHYSLRMDKYRAEARSLCRRWNREDRSE